MSTEEYSITWSEHPRTVVKVFGRFLEEEAMVDCTIAAEGEHLKAHRLMLSACSPYFELLFRREVRKDKVLVLEDIGFEDLKSLIEFVYHGQVTVPKDRLRDFVRAAENLQIKGLPSGLVHNLRREATAVSVVSERADLASHLSHKHMRCSAVGSEISEPQCENLKRPRTGKKQSGDERSFTCLQTDLSEADVCPKQHYVLERNSNRETAAVPADKEPTVETNKEEDVEDSSMCESETGITNTETDLFTSARDGEENRKDLTLVSDTVSNSYGRATSPPILENYSENCLPSCSSVTACIPSSANTAESTEQIVSVKIEPIVRIEVLPAVVSSDNESTVEPMHQVWVKEMRTWEGEEETLGTHCAIVCNQETTNKDQDVTACDLNHLVKRSKLTSASFSCIVAEGEREVVNIRDVKIEEPEMKEHCKKQQSERSVNDSTVDKLVENGQHSIMKIDEIEVEKEELEMVETVEETLETDSPVEQNEAEEEEYVTPLSQCVSTTGKEWHKPSRCADVFDSVSDEQVHVDEQPSTECSNCCEVCKATFANRYVLRRHMRIHSDERPFQCDVCGKFFRQKGSLSIHKRSHTGERPYHCEVCKMTFNQAGALTVHKRTHTGERPFQCNVCGMSFSDKGNLTRHKRIHTGERPFYCEVCKMTFNQMSALTVHKRTHTGERPYKCNVCGMTFSDKGNLTRHNRTHTGERPFFCDVCKMSFKQVGALTVHKRTHTGERPFQCNVCGMLFSEMGNLTRHRRTHTDERPFFCDVCQMTFNQASALTVHKRTHTGERPFQCNVCGMSFSDKGNLTKHRRMHTCEQPF